MADIGLWLNNLHIGELREDSGGLAFSYHGRWLHAGHAFPLSPGLALNSSATLDIGPLQPVRRFVDACLPVPGDRLRIIASNAGVGERDVIGLLTVFGRSGMGAMRWVQRSLPAMPYERQSITAEAAGKLAAAGNAEDSGLFPGQWHKIAVARDEAGILWCCPNAVETNFLLKSPLASNPLGRLEMVSEYVVGKLACRVGMNAIAPELLAWDGGAGLALLIPRYDGATDAFGRHHRLVLVLGSQLTGEPPCLPVTPARLTDIEKATQLRLKTREELFIWAIFNVLVGNTSLHMGKVGAIRWSRGWRLAPFSGMRSGLAAQQWKNPDAEAWRHAEVGLLRDEPMPYAMLTVEWLSGFGESLGIHRGTALSMANDLIASLDSSCYELGNEVLGLTGEDLVFARWYLNDFMVRILDGL